jgi:signal transduction histidine kinase
VSSAPRTVLTRPQDDLGVIPEDDDEARADGYARLAMARLRALDRDRLTLLAAVVLGLEMQVEAWLLPDEPARPRIALALLVLAAAVATSRRAPLPSLVTAQLVFVFAQASSVAVTDHLYVPLFVVLALTFSAAYRVRGRAWWAIPPICFVGGVLGISLDDVSSDPVGDVLWTGLIFAGLLPAAGRLLRARIDLERALREKAERLEQERVAAAEQAAVDERERIAGDLHDIVAHALSGMVIQASAARRLAGSAEPGRAHDAFVAVETSGREALSELRRLLGVLRREDEEIALAPHPSLAHVSSLVARVRAAGLPTGLTVEGEAADLPGGVDVTAYRVVQEALGSALRHGGAGRAEVTVRYRDEGVELEVRDDGAAAGERSLLGMRERVALYGGDLHAGRRREGGHAVRARLPYAEVAA